MRQIVLDTETTGLETSQDHRIIEIGCVEMVDRKLTGRHYHQYINPQRKIDEGAMEVHGITDQFLEDKPLFEGIVSDFFEFLGGAELIIHNASFDIGFINHESKKLHGKHQPLESQCRVIDTLALARQRHPGQKNNLDALCKRYGVDNSQRQLHGALLDAEILADVYLLMTGGQVNLNINDQSDSDSGEMNKTSVIRRLPEDRPPLRVVKASDEEIVSHEQKLSAIVAAAGQCIWQGSGE
ncbi:MAG: DNA polymerase III subunit epsilon [Porticoccaceae bacterium]|jgi:DNA polymerase-3 subunit epsilon|nr:DNA polymerase III subunit epsilon [Porticoccaceae bacterium]MBT4165231.1 DNA polymerase III subunit epsilon [Porticoccaceae bacterium]MBT4592033.1 DNA polymerase III subunit epsilon [Porticoccaceae bacterium]MBT6028209.1 DNA polymerase III subunit epsilon [Porticoccaceae bacterium]MBT7565321.1 DNA polymerase III subunit epsilon [Porticoccaceae bacterium]